MQERHRTPDLYFREQKETTARYVIPFIGSVRPVTGDLNVLEIGCGHGGNMEPFLDLGCRVTGIDINPHHIQTAERFLRDHPNRHRLKLMAQDIYATRDELSVFDLIIMKDVIEHLHDQQTFMGFIRKFLSKEGRIFFGFPPWLMPFGGHQQVCRSRLLSALPYFHLLPSPIYRLILQSFGETPERIGELLEIKETGLSIERFRKIVNSEGYHLEKEQLFLVNPNYETKFGLKPRRQFSPVASLPVLRNFVTTCCYALVRRDESRRP